MRSSPVHIPATQTSSTLGDGEVETEEWSTLPPELRVFMEMFEEDESAGTPSDAKSVVDGDSSGAVPRNHLIEEKGSQYASASACCSGSETESDSDGELPKAISAPVDRLGPSVGCLSHHEDTGVAARQLPDISSLPRSAVLRRKLQAASRAAATESALCRSRAETNGSHEDDHYASAGAALSVPPSDESSTVGSEDGLHDFSLQTLPEAVRAFAEMFETECEH
jgi:hypothetical protein